MGTTGGRANPALVEQLVAEPGQFSFFQAVRLLEFLLRELDREEDDSLPRSVGYDVSPNREVARFKIHQSHSFPGCEITEAKLPKGRDVPAELTLSFLGLTGPSGVLPHHYTTLIIDRGRQRDFTLRDFLDLFNHRTISLFYRAWEKYRFPFGYERTKVFLPARRLDSFTQSLFSVVGLGTGHLRGRMQVDDEAFLLYAGHFAHAPRNAISLEAVLADYFGLTVQVRQYRGLWLRLSPDEQSRLPDRWLPEGSNCGLGVDTIVGERVWSVESGFRIRLGPLSYPEFLRFIPGTDSLQRLGQIVRTYVGPEYDFDVQVLLCAEDVPECRLGGREDSASRLGWNTWIQSTGFTRDAEDAIFRLDGDPSRSAVAN